MYKYKGIIYDHAPFKKFHVIEIELIDGVEIKVIERRFSFVTHLIIISFIVFCNIFLLNSIITSHNTVEHIIRVPEKMYYDSDLRILNLDITNDISNIESVSIKLLDTDGNTIFKLNGIEPNESVGGIYVESEEFNVLPCTCMLEYSYYTDLNVYTKNLKVSILDSKINYTQYNDLF